MNLAALDEAAINELADFAEALIADATKMIE
jgi:hypothetical protein